MKKQLKIIRNYIGKYLLNFLIKTKQFKRFPIFIKFFPKSRYKAMHSLMRRGYLELAYQVWQNSTEDIKDFEQEIVQRVVSMQQIRKDGVQFPLSSYDTSPTIHPLFVVHNSLPYDKSGYAIRTHSIVTNLKDDIDLEVVTRAGYPWDLQKHRELPFKASDMIDGIEYIRLFDKDKFFKKGSDLDYINIYADEIIKVAREKNSTILHASSNYFNALASLKASESLKLPVIYEMRGLWHITRTTLDSEFKYQGMYEYEEVLERSIALQATKVVTISEALKVLLLSWGIDEEKISVIPNAVDLDKFKPLEKNKELLKKYNLKDKFVIGFIGSITKYEGLYELIKSIDRLYYDGYEDIVLMIVGDGKELESLKKLSNSQNIIFTGRVPFEEVNNYYSIFDICPFPRNNYEVCRYVPPLKVLEAMAMEKAIIVSDVAPLLEIVNDRINGLVCISDDIDSLTNTILQVYRDDKLRESIAKNASEWVGENRSWKAISNRYIKLYLSL